MFCKKRGNGKGAVCFLIDCRVVPGNDINVAICNDTSVGGWNDTTVADGNDINVAICNDSSVADGNDGSIVITSAGLRRLVFTFFRGKERELSSLLPLIPVM